MRYLTDYNIRMAVHRGKAVEQLLKGGMNGESPTIRRLVLTSRGDTFHLEFYETYDEGSDTFLDVYEFSLVAPDDDPPEHFFDTLDEALAYATSVYAAAPPRWVNESVVQDEYAEYRRTIVS